MPVNSSTIVIRKAVREDAERIAFILSGAFAEFRHLYTLEAFNATVISPAKVIERMKEGDVWLAIHDGEAVGTVASTEKKDALYIRGMAVLPKARGLKVGSCLLKHIEKEAMKKNYNQLLLSTTPFLHTAIELYKKYGFTKGHKEEFFGTDLFIMEKSLK